MESNIDYKKKYFKYKQKYIDLQRKIISGGVIESPQLKPNLDLENTILGKNRIGVIIINSQ